MMTHGTGFRECCNVTQSLEDIDIEDIVQLLSRPRSPIILVF